MSARLSVWCEPETPPPTAHRNDDLESFWLLWVTLRCCEHKLWPKDVVDSLRHIGHTYLDETGQIRGSFHKAALLESRCLINTMSLGNRPLATY